MKATTSAFLLFLLFCVACKEQPQSYTVPLQESKTLVSELWQQGKAGSLYTDLYITEDFYAFTENDNDTVLKVFAKSNPMHYVGFDIKQGKERKAYSLDFVKNNTRYESGKNDIWLIEYKWELKQLRPQNGSLIPIKTEILSSELRPSTSYHFMKEELYGVPARGGADNAFYFFHPDSGHYRVEMHGATKNMKSHYKKNPYAFLSNLCVSEDHNAVVCAFLFINQIQFFDLRGNIVRAVKVGDNNAAPINDIDGSLDYKKSAKYMLDICSSDKYVYCIFNGSEDFNDNSLILTFKWDGTHIKTYQADRQLKKIAYDKFTKKLVALAANEQDVRDVVCYDVK